MNRKGFAEVAIVLIVVAVLIAGGIWYYEAHRGEASTASPGATSSVATTTVPATPSNTSGWLTYTSSQYGFSFEYPPGMKIQDGGPYTSQSGTQPDSLDGIEVYDTTAGPKLFEIDVYSPGIVQGNYGWPERPCGEWTFGPDSGPLSSQDIMFAGQRTLYLVSREFGANGTATSSFETNNYYCVNYSANPIVISFDQAQANQIQSILATFQFSASKLPMIATTTLSADGRIYIYSNSTYGLNFRYPASGDINPVGGDTGYQDNSNYFGQGNFSDNDQGILLAQYSDDGDPFSIFVDPNASNSSSCNQFFQPAGDEASPASFQNINGNQYSEIQGFTGAMAASIELYQFHTFKNNFCYEFDFEVNVEDGLPFNSSTAEKSFVNDIFPNISFFTPSS